jgi:hypothetical protein
VPDKIKEAAEKARRDAERRKAAIKRTTDARDGVDEHRAERAEEKIAEIRRAGQRRR